MADAMALKLVSKELVASQVVLSVSYDADNISNASLRAKYHGEVDTDYYGRPAPKAVHGSVCFGRPTSSSRIITEEVKKLFDSIVNPDLLVRRLNITVNNVVPASSVHPECEQLNLFVDPETVERRHKFERAELDKEKRLQQAQVALKRRFGKNAVLKGLNFEEGATAKERNRQIGGHKE